MCVCGGGGGGISLFSLNFTNKLINKKTGSL